MAHFYSEPEASSRVQLPPDMVRHPEASVRDFKLYSNRADSVARENHMTVDAIVTIALGIWIFLVGLGKARVSKNSEANAAFVRSWGLVFKIAGPVMIGAALVRVVSAR